MPDDRRFGIIWMSEKALAGAYDLDGAFSSVSVKLLRDASEREVITRLDALLDRYGGRAAYGRKDQTSHAWLDHELDMLNNMSRTLTPIFLLVSAFLVNLTLSRLVALEREQIGLLKALGYRQQRDRVSLHQIRYPHCGRRHRDRQRSRYLARRRTSRGCSEIFFIFRFLVFVKSPDLYVIAAALSLVGRRYWSWSRALRDVVTLAPAVAMQPPAPPHFRQLLPASLRLDKFVSQPTVMMLRDITHHPDPGGIHDARDGARQPQSSSSRCSCRDTMEQLIDVTYFMADRQDATVSFVEKRAQRCRLAGCAASRRSCGRALSGSACPHTERQHRTARHYQRQAARCRSQPHYRH